LLFVRLCWCFFASVVGGGFGGLGSLLFPVWVWGGVFLCFIIQFFLGFFEDVFSGVFYFNFV
ncbi:hypothetical protein ACNIU2_26490, partial [Escherichia coli]